MSNPQPSELRPAPETTQVPEEGASVIDERAKRGAIFAVVVGGICLAIAVIWAALQ